MINLILTIACSTSIALILKHNDTKEGHPVVLLMGNYFVASLLGLLFMLLEDNLIMSFESLAFGALMALFFVGSFFIFTQAVKIAGAALSTVSSRLSVVIPVALSVIVFGEEPSLYHLGGFMAAVATIFFFYFSLKTLTTGKLEFRDYFILFALLLGIGSADFGMKIFQGWRAIEEKPFFLFSIFSFSFVYTAGYVLIKKIRVQISTFRRGAILGVPNIFSTFFLIGALNQLPAIIVYPITNIGIIVATTIAAVIIWGERLNKFGILALISGIISIVLLGMQ